MANENIVTKQTYAWRKNASYSYGAPFPELASHHVHQLGCQRVYVMASGSLIRNTNALKRLQDALGSRIVGIRKGIQPHSLWSEILELTEAARECKADCLMTLGGGSLTDSAKIVTLALANNVHSYEDLERILAVGAPKGKRLPPKDIAGPNVPVICIPTTLSAGEHSNFGGGTDPRTKRKHSFTHPDAAPRIVIFDPELALLTPAWVWLSTGIRAIDHCLETLGSFESTPDADETAAQGLELLVPNLIASERDPTDLNARLQCQLGSALAMNAVCLFIPMGGSHAIGHQLGPFGVSHGHTSCILSPAVFKKNASVNAARQQRIYDILWSNDTVRQVLIKGKLKQDTADVADCLDIIFREVCVPRTLQEVGIADKDLDPIAENTLKDFWAPTNPIPLTTKEQVLDILRDCL